MTEKLAIVTIDAGSDVEAKVLKEPRVGTSSGKGTLAQAVRDSGGLAYDSGRAYRTVTLAAAHEGLRAGEEGFLEALAKWDRAGRFGNCPTGLSLDGVEIDEEILHGVDVSRRVASFGAVPEVRRLTKNMKLSWLNNFVPEFGATLIAFDGRQMRELVQDEVVSGATKIEGTELVTSFCMVVDPIEAARRRMAQRKVIEYADPKWAIHPKLAETAKELEDRAKADEGRADDSVGIPSTFYTYQANEANTALALSSTHTSMEVPRLIRSKTPVLIDTTGVGIPAVNHCGLGHILEALSIIGGFDEEEERLFNRLDKT